MKWKAIPNEPTRPGFYVCFAPDALLGSTPRPFFLSCALGCGQGISPSGRQDLGSARSGTASCRAGVNRFYRESHFCTPSSFTVRNAESRPFCAGRERGSLVACSCLDVSFLGLPSPPLCTVTSSHQLSPEMSCELRCPQSPGVSALSRLLGGLPDLPWSFPGAP